MKDNFNIFDGIEVSKEEQKIIDLASDLSDIICKIAKRRVDMRLTQRDLAELTNIKQPMIARIESLNSIPRIDTLMTILKALQMKIELKALEEKKYETIFIFNISSENVKDVDHYYLKDNNYNNSYINTVC